MKIPASYHQERLWFIDKFEFEYLYESSPTYHNIPLILNIEGPLDTGILERSIRDVINRHEALRTRIVNEEEKPFQSIAEEVNFHLPVTDVTDGPGAGEYDRAIALAVEEANTPFLLQKDLLIRGKLIRFQEQRFILVLTVHHIVADRHSIGILAEEMLLFYNGYLSGKPPQLPGLSIHYADFSQWQRNLPVELIESLSAYWKIKLAGKLPALELPTYRPRALVHIYKSARKSFAFSKKLSDRIKAFGKREKISDYTTLAAAFNLLLYKYSGCDEIVMGTSGSNRTQPGLEKIIGPIANLLVLRSHLSASFPFREIVSQLSRTVNEAYKYQHMPFDKLVLELKPDIDMSRTALFDVLFQYEENPIHIPPVENLKITVVETNLGWGKYDLNLLIQNQGEIFSGILVYNSEYFNPSAISPMIEHYMKLLEDVLEHPDRQVSGFSLLTDREQRKLLMECSGLPADFPREKTVHELFEEQVEKNPGGTAVIDADNDTAALTYNELNNRAGRLAYLLKEKGVQPDTIAAVIIERSIEMIIGILGILKAGGAYMPIDPDYPPDRIDFMLKDSNAKILLRRAGEGNKASNAFEIIETGAGNSALTSSCRVGPANLAYIIYTSGTTGKPKGVLITHRNVVRLMVNDKFLFDFTSHDVWTMFHSYCFDFSVWEMYGALLYGGQLVIIPKSAARDAPKYLDLLKKKNVTILNQTPSAFYHLINLELQNPGIESALRYVIFGGEALAPNRLKEWQSRFPKVKLINMYGITETTVHVTFKEITGDVIESNISNIGTAIPTLSTYIMDGGSKLTPRGVAGELCVGGEGVGKGYLNRPQLTADKFIRNPYNPRERLYKSGDLARLSEKGELEYLGRIDHQVKIRGFRIELGEIEAQLLTHDGISEAVVLEKEWEGGEKYLCAYFVSDTELPVTELRDYLGKKLPDYMVPPYFVQVDKIPLTANGKINRKALPTPETGVSAEDIAAPRNKFEIRLVQIWAEILGIKEDKIGIKTNFFEIGGNSLNLLTLVSKVYKEFDTVLSVTQVFTNPTIKEISEYIGAKEYVEKAVALLNWRTDKNIFCFPPGVGYGVTYQPLAFAFKDYSFYAFNFIEDENRVDQYADLIKEIQPEGPYILFGWSAAGPLIFEVAKALENRSGEVAGIILADSFWVEKEERELSIEAAENSILKQAIYGLETMGLEFLKDNVEQKMKKYIVYLQNVDNLETVQAAVHLLRSETERDSDEFKCWDTFTAKGTTLYQGFGNHGEMFNEGILEKNAEVIKEIIRQIEAKV